ncbi:hypothetical protein PSPO01_13995 [Paraphaeosphaeria sporulosa]
MHDRRRTKAAKAKPARMATFCSTARQARSGRALPNPRAPPTCNFWRAYLRSLRAALMRAPGCLSALVLLAVVCPSAASEVAARLRLAHPAARWLPTSRG